MTSIFRPWTRKLLLLFLAGGIAGPVVGETSRVKIDVDAARSSAMPDLMRAGVFTFKPEPPDYAMQQWLTEMRPGVVEIDIGGPVFQMADDAEDVLHRASKLLPLLKRIRAAGGEPVLAITRIPIWLSSRPKALETADGDVVPKASIVAPRDGNEWAALVERVIGVFKQGLGRTPDIKVGWEPDQSAWQGSEADFFAFYRDTVKGVKRADKTARVGGPSVSALYNGKGGEGAPALIPRFLRYCATTPLPELGLPRLPVDFLIWHQFGSDAVLAWDLAANQARSWLKEAGYPATTELMIGEWSSWLAWPSPDSAEQDRPALAAYVVASLAAMDRAGIHRAAFTSLVEQREVEGQALIGSFGLFSNQFIKKPSYWAFAALGKLGGVRLQAHSADPLVTVLAGKPSPQEVALVVATSVPGDRALLRTLLAKAIQAGASFDQIRREVDAKKLERVLAGDGSLADLRLGAPLRQAMEAAAADVLPLARDSRALRGRPRLIAIDVTGIDATKSRVEIWRIDSRHANAHAVRDRIGTLLQRRLAEEKRLLPQGLMGRFEARGYKTAQIEAFKNVMNSRNREAALAGRDGAERKAVRAMADEAQAFIHERLAAIGQEVNAWPEVTFKPVEGEVKRNGKTIEFEMEDDAVAFVRIVRN